MFPLKMVIFHSYVKLPEGISFGHKTWRFRFKVPQSSLQTCRGWASLCSSSWVLATLGETSKALGFLRRLQWRVERLNHRIGWNHKSHGPWMTSGRYSHYGLNCWYIFGDLCCFTSRLSISFHTYLETWSQLRSGHQACQWNNPLQTRFVSWDNHLYMGRFPTLFDEGNPGSIFWAGTVHIPSDSHTWQWEFPLLTGTSLI